MSKSSRRQNDIERRQNDIERRQNDIGRRQNRRTNVNSFRH